MFRGFAIADPMAPFVVVNDQDAKAAWSFTLLHELAHLWLGVSGVSGVTPNGNTEKFCNDVAAATLISPGEINAIALNGTPADAAAISAFAAQCRVSRGMVAYQLFRAGRVNEARWATLRDVFHAEWRADKVAAKAASSATEGGPNWYIVKRHRVGKAILDIARQGMAGGNLTPTRAARLLGVKPMSVYPLLAAPAQRPRAA